MARNGPVLLRDWHGLRVELRRAAENQLARLPIGTTGVIRRSGRGLTFVTNACDTCGVQVLISNMRPDDFTVLTPRDEWPDTRGQGRRSRRSDRR